MGAKQGLENVVEAARLAERQELPIRFVLAGDGNQREHLERLADGCATLEFMGPLPEPEYLRALQAADVLLLNELPGLTETAVPSKLTSYFASGRPVLAATEPGSVSADEVRASGAGVVINPGEPATGLGAA
jgi:colanic acid biosynthesis glycosyl transferase WcaI